MAFLSVGKSKVPDIQRLYLMEITLPTGMIVVKIGKASGSSSKNRMLQICGGIFDKFRKTPMIYIKKDTVVPTDLVFQYENILHRFFTDYRYYSKVPFDGHTECFTIPLDDAVMAYEAVINGHVPEHIYEMPEPVEQDSLTF